MSDRHPPRWTKSKWHGMDNYECTGCPFATLDYGAMVQHARQRHPRGWDAPTEDPLADINFSDHSAGAEFAIQEVERGVDANALRHALLSTTPSGKTGYTKADVERAVGSLTTPTTEE